MLSGVVHNNVINPHDDLIHLFHYFMVVHETISFDHYKCTLILHCGIDMVNCRFSKMPMYVGLSCGFHNSKNVQLIGIQFSALGILIECDPDQDEAVMKNE